MLLYFKQGMSAAAGYASLEYGASIRIRRLQINFTMTRGLINMSKSKEYTVKQNKAMSISATLCF